MKKTKDAQGIKLPILPVRTIKARSITLKDHIYSGPGTEDIQLPADALTLNEQDARTIMYMVYRLEYRCSYRVQFNSMTQASDRQGFLVTCDCLFFDATNEEMVAGFTFPGSEPPKQTMVLSGTITYHGNVILGELPAIAFETTQLPDGSLSIKPSGTGRGLVFSSDSTYATYRLMQCKLCGRRTAHQFKPENFIGVAVIGTIIFIIGAFARRDLTMILLAVCFPTICFFVYRLMRSMPTFFTCMSHHAVGGVSSK